MPGFKLEIHWTLHFPPVENDKVIIFLPILKGCYQNQIKIMSTGRDLVHRNGEANLIVMKA